jgi:hypothetical protein
MTDTQYLARGQTGTENVNAALNEVREEILALSPEVAIPADATLEEYTIATLPAEPEPFVLVYVSDGGNEGAPTLAFWDGDEWLTVPVGPALDLGGDE